MAGEAQGCGKAERDAEDGDMGGWPLASSATVLSRKGTGAFVLKGEPLDLRDPHHVIGLKRP